MTDFLMAEAGIRQLHARYADAVWRKDVDSFIDCFAEDCEWRIFGQVLRGRAETRAFIGEVFGRLKHILITLRPPILEVGDGVASARVCFTEQSVRPDGRPLALIGTDFERFVEEGGRWRFSWRHFQCHYYGPPDYTGSYYDNPDYGPPPAMPPPDAVPVNHRN
jgi:uncharacterized protein (TIGR02246 family)